MKKALIVISMIVIISFLLSCSTCDQRRPDLLTILPSDTQNLILIPNTQYLVNNIMEFLTLFKKGVVYDSLKKEIELASGKLGINLLNSDSIREAGFDPTGPLAIVSVPINYEGRAQMANLLIMTYSDKGRAENTLNRLAREREKTEIFKSRSYMGARIVTAIRQGQKGEKPVLTYAIFKGYVIYAIPEKGDVGIRKIIDTKVENSLLKNNYYSSIITKVKNGNVLFFINSGKNINASGFLLNREMQRMLNSIKENFNGLIMSLMISKKGVYLSSFVGLSTKSMENLNKYFTTATKEETEALLRIVPDEPFILTRLNLNFASIYALMKKEDPFQMMIIDKRLFGPILKYMDVNVQEDILPLIKGSLVYAVSPGELQNINNAIENGFRGEAFNKLFNVYYSMSLNDSSKSSRFLESFVEHMKRKGQNVDSIHIDNISVSSSRFGAAFNSYWFIKDSNFYAFYSDEKVEKIVLPIKNKEKIPFQRMSSTVKEILLNPSSQIVSLNFAPLRKVMDNIDEERLNSITSTGLYRFGFVLAKELVGKLDNMILYILPNRDGISLNFGLNVKE